MKSAISVHHVWLKHKWMKIYLIASEIFAVSLGIGVGIN